MHRDSRDPCRDRLRVRVGKTVLVRPERRSIGELSISITAGAALSRRGPENSPDSITLVFFGPRPFNACTSFVQNKGARSLDNITRGIRGRQNDGVARQPDELFSSQNNQSSWLLPPLHPPFPLFALFPTAPPNPPSARRFAPFLSALMLFPRRYAKSVHRCPMENADLHVFLIEQVTGMRRSRPSRRLIISPLFAAGATL